MGKIKIEQSIRVYEIEGKDVETEEKIININSHWNYNSLVVLEIEGKTFAVDGEDILTAVKNAMNSGE